MRISDWSSDVCSSDLLLPLFIHGARLDDAGLTGTVMAMTERVGREAFVRQQHAIMSRRDHSATLVAIRVPTLVLCVRQDALTPLADPQPLAAGLSDSSFVVVDGRKSDT